MKNTKFTNMKKGRAWAITTIIIAIVIIIAAIGAFSIWFKPIANSGEDEKSMCDNSVCESGEGCFSCPEDCKCGVGEYCSELENSCTVPVCGNGVCESFEGPDSCCTDCPCTIPGEICDSEKLTCEIPVFTISDEEIIELATTYSEEQGKTVESTEIIETTEFDGQLVRTIRVYHVGEDWFVTYAINQDGVVRVLPLY